MVESSLSPSVLRAEGLVAGYDGPPVLDGVSLEVFRQEIVVVLGPNGAGKSTVAKTLLGLLRVTAGRVLLVSEDVTGEDPHVLVRKGVGYLPQVQNVFDELTVSENLEIGGHTYPGRIKDRIELIFELFPGLRASHKKKAGALSGGEQRMVALARVLMIDPLIAILDEPTAGLSPIYADKVWEHIVRMRESGVAILVIEQNAKLAMSHADRAYIISRGRVVLSGIAKDLMKNSDVAAILVG